MMPQVHLLACSHIVSHMAEAVLVDLDLMGSMLRGNRRMLEKPDLLDSYLRL